MARLRVVIADVEGDLDGVVRLLSDALGVALPARAVSDVVPTPPLAAAPALKARARAVAPGSIEDRVLAVLRERSEPVTMSVLIAGTRAGAWPTRRAVRALEEAHRIGRRGSGKHTRYVLQR